MLIKIQFIFAAFLRKFGKHAFILSITKKSVVLDVGCGNNSPFKVKTVLPDSKYTGVDIGDYNQSKVNLADSYILTTPAKFSETIVELGQKFDAVICSHNLEHCNDRDATFLAILSSVRKGGRIYLSFPCSESVTYPKRLGTLNYFDDKTHVGTPPDFQKIRKLLIHSGYELTVEIPNYRPLILRSLGWVLEPISAIKQKVLRGTWEFYGFESIIWAKKVK